MLSNSRLSLSSQSIDNKDADEVSGKGDDDVSQRNGQEKKVGVTNKEDDQHVQDFRAELDSLLVQQKEGYANSTNRDSTASPSVSTARPSINTASKNINSSSPNINTASPIPNDSKPKKVIQALTNPSWIEAMQKELLQFKLQKVWTLVDLPKGKRAIRTKWVYRNKKDERGIVVRNKARLVAQGYTQEEGIDYDEVFALVARIEAIRLFLAYASFMGLIVYQMDVKSAFLYGTIEEEVYVCQPPGFEDPQFPDKVYKVEKALYGLHQAPRAWYETLSTYLLENGYRRGTIDKTLFIKKDRDDVQVIPDEFYGGAHFLLRIAITVKAASTPIETNKALLKDEEAKDVDVRLYRSLIRLLMFYQFDLIAFSDSDYAGASLDRKSTTGGCQFLGKRLISWQCKKQTIVANSTTEAEYVAAANCCGQVLWIQNQMLDYGFNFMNTKIHIDNESTICIVKNPMFHSKTKNIEIRHHFIRDSYEKKLIQVIKIHTDHNVADLLTKAFDVSRELVQSNDPPLSRVNTLGSGEDIMKLMELMEHCTKLSELKSEGSKGFHQIIDFLTTSHIRYVLTESPTIYVSLIEQFWQTASASTLKNGDMEITATIDGKVKVVSEASIRRHLKLEDCVGISTLPTSNFFEQLALICSKKTAWEQFSSNIATAIICLATNRTFNFSKLIFDAMGEGSTILVESHHTPISAPSTSQPPTSLPSMQTTYVVEETDTMPHDSPLLRVYSLGSDDGSMTLNELTVLCTTLSKKVETLESDLKHTKLTYGAAYIKLIMKVKQLKHKVKSCKARRRVRLIVSEDEDELEDPSKQGRKISQIDKDKGITLFIAPEEDYIAEPDISIANVLVSNVEQDISIASPEVKTAAESLVYIRRSATKRKDKGKAIMKEAC
ncbi:putative ribonuclease H-like domain-containing protein [Tanacetum coccineum]